MIIRCEVYLREIIFTLKLVKKVINHGYGVLILDCDFVQMMIIDAYFERTVFLAHKKNYNTPWKDIGPDETLI